MASLMTVLRRSFARLLARAPNVFARSNIKITDRRFALVGEQLGNFAAFVTVLILAARAKIRWLLRLLAIAVVLMVSFFSNGALMPSRVSDPVPAWADSFPLGVFLLGFVPPLILAFPFLRAERATTNADQEPGASTDPGAD